MKKTRDIVILTAGKILLILTSVFSIRIFTTLISPYEVGRLNILSVIYGWFGLIFIAPVGNYVTRKLLEWNKEGMVKKYMTSILGYYFVVSIFATLLIMVLRVFFNVGVTVSWVILLTIGSVLFSNGNTSFIGWINIYGKRLQFVLFSILTVWLGLLFSSFFALKINPSAEYWLFGNLVAQGLILVPAVFYLFKASTKTYIEKNKLYTSSSIKKVLKFSWPFAISSFLYWLQSQGYLFVFKKITSFEMVGIFTVGIGVGNKLMVPFEDLFNQYYRPLFYKEISNSTETERAEAWNRYAYAFFPAVIIMAIYIFMNGPLIAKVFTGEKFHKAGYIILWGAIIGGMQMVSSVITLVSHAQFETKPLIAPGVTLAFSSLLFIFLLVPKNPFLGGGIALSLGWLLYIVHLYSNMKRQLPIRIPWLRMGYAVILSLPMFCLTPLLYRYGNTFSMIKSLLILFISGIYWFVIQFILARKWIFYSLKISFIDSLENKIKFLFIK